MLLQPSLSPKTLPIPSPPISVLFIFQTQLSKTPHFRNPKTPHHWLLLRASASDTQTLPQSAIQRIADKLRSLGYVDDNDKENPRDTLNSNVNSNFISPGEIFVPSPNQLPKYRVGHTIDPSWSTPENPVPEPGSGNAIRRYHELRREVWKEKKEDKLKTKAGGRESVPTLAELKLSAVELKRLRGLGIGLKKKLKIGKPGITEGIVNGIHERWRRTELVKIVCEDMCRLNMKRTHDLLERKTGGLVVWRSGSNIILYRGADYKYPYFFDGNIKPNDTSDDASLDLSMNSGVQGENESSSSHVDDVSSVGHYSSNKTAQPALIQGVGSPHRVRFQLPGEAQLAEESDHLLEGLGPRFTDWYGYDPLPVDADLLPAIVPGYRRPFRLLPYGVKPKLTDDEMTTLRRLGRPLPCHFALGRNRKHQGLAASILKLWEKCEIAKVAVKRGVQNTNSELMAEELKRLTGGTLLTRDREYIVLYRGKDFLPAAVSSAIEQRRKHGVRGQESGMISSSSDAQENKYGRMEHSSEAEHGGISDKKVIVGSEQRKLMSREATITRTSTKLSMALVKKERAEKLLGELEMEKIQKQPEIDKEGITEEERYMLRKVGLKMKPFLLLGRRGVFDGTVENMHLHWKYRELVKILSGESSIDEVHAIARTLEAESGGILVAVERVGKGHAIIVYRGKNYKRPASLRPRTLLTKREALKRSIEAQRRESLKLHVLKLNRNVDELKLKLAKDKETINIPSARDWKLQLEMKESQSDTDFETCSPNPASDQENVVARDGHGADSTSFSTNDSMDASIESVETTQQDVLREFSIEYEGLDSVESDFTEPEKDISRDSVQPSQQGDENEFDTTKANALNELVKETDVVMGIGCESGAAESTSTSSTCPANFKLQGQTSNSSIGVAEPHESITKNKGPLVDQPIQRRRENESSGKPFRAARLSNRERLLLRKQALEMKYRPVLAVGRSNIVTGVAKTINTHFQKHPLAIVNVKGRAKGTSVQELVFKLEEATGAVLVSQEPNKVILYRGWGGQTNGNTRRDLRNTLTGREDTAKQIISPELISAIRLECGLQCKQESENFP